MSRARRTRREIKNCDQEISNHEKQKFYSLENNIKIEHKNHVWSRGMELSDLV